MATKAERMGPDQDDASGARGEDQTSTAPRQDPIDLSNNLHNSERLTVGGYDGGTDGGFDTGNDGAYTVGEGGDSPRKRRRRRTRDQIDAEAQAQATVLTESLSEQAEQATEMIIMMLNVVAMRVAGSEDAQMAMTEQMMIQPALQSILSKPRFVRQASDKAPYVALILGAALWVDRVNGLRNQQRYYGPSMDQNTGADETFGENGTTPAEEMPDTSEAISLLQSMRMN